MSRTSGIYRPLTPITPSHTPSGSIASTRSRTPGQLSLHEYRKLQRQEVDPAPVSTAPISGQRTVRRKGAVLSFHGAPTGIPTAPPTPREFEFGLKDEDEDVTEEELVDRFLSGNGRIRKGKEPRREGSRLPARDGIRSSLSTPRLRPKKRPSLASTASISSLPLMAPSTTRSASQSLPQSTSRLDPSPPPSPSTPLLAPQTGQTPALALPIPDSLPHHFLHRDSPPIPYREPTSYQKRTNFKPIKRLPRPASQLLPPLIPSPLSVSPASAPASTSSYSPFSLGKYSFPDPPFSSSDALPLHNPSTESLYDVSPRILPTIHPDSSFTDLLRLYGTSFELINRHDSLQSLNIIPSLSEPSSPDLSSLPVFAPKLRLPDMPESLGDPFDRQFSTLRHGDGSSRSDEYHTRESRYQPEFDSRSIMTTAPQTPGMKKGITDYSDAISSADEGSYTPVTNRIFDLYERNSGESLRPFAQRTVGAAPTLPPPPVPLEELPHLIVPLEQSTSLERTTDYGNTQHLLREPSSTPGLEIDRRGPSTLTGYQPVFQLPSTSYLQPSSIPDFEDALSRSSSVSNEWVTIGNNSTNDITNEDSLGESFQFHQHDKPPVLMNHQRRIITQNYTPEVPSLPSTVPESHPSLQATSLIHGDTGDDDLYGVSVQTIPTPSAPDAQGTSSMPVASSEYSRNIQGQAETFHPEPTSAGNGADTEPQQTMGHYIQNITEPIFELDTKSTPAALNRDNGLVDPAVLSSEPNDSIETLSTNRLSRWENLTSPLNQRPNAASIRRSLTNPDSLMNERISFYDPESGKTIIGVAGQNKLMDFGIEMHRLNPDTSTKNSPTGADGILSSIEPNQETVHLNAEPTTVGPLAPSTAPPARMSPLTRLRATFTRARPTVSSQNTSLDNTIPLPQNPYPPTYGRPASSARSSLQPLVPRPAPVADNQRRRAQAWKPLRIKPKESPPQPEISYMSPQRGSFPPPPQLPPPQQAPTPAVVNKPPTPARFHEVATYPCYSPTPSVDLEANQRLSNEPEFLAGQKEHMRKQKVWSRVYMAVCSLLPFLLPLYSLGVLDPIMELHVPSRPHMLRTHRRWAWNILWVWVVLILVALTVWGVSRRGT
jgi:hypothetical protein